MLGVSKITRDLFTDPNQDHQYRLIKKSAHYEDSVKHELSHMFRKIAVKIKDGTFANFIEAIISGFSDLKEACGACDLREGDSVLLFSSS